MDFFSKLGKKASQTYQVTKEKAANLSEELKLKGKVNDLKDKIDNIYNEIGQIVYNEIKDGKDVSKEEVTAKCDEISKIKDEIERIQVDILTLKKVRKCTNCGEELDLDDVFCCKCGTKQPEPEKVEVKDANVDEVKEAEIIEVNNVENGEENSSNDNNAQENNTETIENNNKENVSNENNNDENQNNNNQ